MSANARAFPRHELENALRNSRFYQDFCQFCGNPEELSAGFNNVQFPATRDATVMPVGIARGKFQGEMISEIPLGS
jgi:hypothetical protein